MASIKIKIRPSTLVAYLNNKDRMPKAFVAGELTEYEFVNAVSCLGQQVNEAQVALLSVAVELAMGVSAQAHVGTGGGGSTSDLPWMDKKDSKTKKSDNQKYMILVCVHKYQNSDESKKNQG